MEFFGLYLLPKSSKKSILQMVDLTIPCVPTVSTRESHSILIVNSIPGGGAYAIPNQETIDRIIEESEGGFDALFKDTNDMDLNVDSDGDGNTTNDIDGDRRSWDTALL